MISSLVLAATFWVNSSTKPSSTDPGWAADPTFQVFWASAVVLAQANARQVTDSASSDFIGNSKECVDQGWPDPNLGRRPRS